MKPLLLPCHALILSALMLAQGGDAKLTGNWRVAGRIVSVTAATDVDQGRGPVTVNLCVQVLGNDNADATVATPPIRVQSGTGGWGTGADDEDSDRTEFRGLLQVNPPASDLGTWQVDGRTNVVDALTRVLPNGRTITANAQTTLDTSAGPLRLGACAEVLGQQQNSGAVLARRITVQPASGTSVTRGGVADSASFDPQPVPAGQLISVFGRNIGPAVDLPVQLGRDNKVSSRLDNTMVRFAGSAAPILFASQGQLNVVALCKVAGKTSSVMQIESNGAWTNTQTLPVVPASPSIFTQSNSGQGPGAILNYDSTTKLTALNSPSHRAERGSTIVIYAAGLGATTPACTDGAITSTTNLPRPVLPVTVKIGGKDAVVEYAGLAPMLEPGVFPVNVKVPQDEKPRANAPGQLTAGGRSSQEGVSVAVR